MYKKLQLGSKITNQSSAITRHLSDWGRKSLKDIASDWIVACGRCNLGT